MAGGDVEQGFQKVLGGGRNFTADDIRELTIDPATERLRVEALFAGVVEVNLDLDNDEVAIGGSQTVGPRLLYKVIDDGSGARGRIVVQTDPDVPVQVFNHQIPISGPAVAPLGAGGTHVLGPIATDGFARITGGAFADVAGSFVVEQSIDGGATFRTSDSFAVPGGGLPTFFSVEVRTGFVRITYTNGGAPQTAFEFEGFLRAMD